jgi:hypothetical protein
MIVRWQNIIADLCSTRPSSGPLSPTTQVSFCNSHSRKDVTHSVVATFLVMCNKNYLREWTPKCKAHVPEQMRGTLRISYLLCNVLRRRCRFVSRLPVLESWGCLCGRNVVLSQLHGGDEGCDTNTARMSSNFGLDKAVLWSRSSKPTTCPASVVPLEAWPQVVPVSSLSRSLYLVIVILTVFLVTYRTRR